MLLKQREVQPTAKKQIRYVLLGISISLITSVVISAILPLLGYSNLVSIGPVSIVFFIGYTTYAILRHQLFDIRVIIRKIVLYSALLGSVFAVYSAITLILTSYLPLGDTLSNFIAAAFIAFGFEPLRRWLQRTTEKSLFVKEYDADAEIHKLTQTLSNVVDLDEALRQMMQTTVSALKLDRAATLVLEKDVDNHHLQVRRVQEINFPAPKRLMSDESLPVIRYFQARPITQLVEDMRQDVEQEEATNRELVRTVRHGLQGEMVERVRLLAEKKAAVSTLIQLKVAIVIPILVKSHLIGLLYLGHKLSNDYFYDDDLNFLNIVGAQTGNAIEKARFYEEDQLKSEFVSIASHELLTPTAAIEGYLSMILDENMGQIDDKARHFLEKVYVSAQRLSKLVKDLLSVSRIEAGRIKIEPKIIDLLALTREQIEQLMPKATEANLKLALESPPHKTAAVFADPERTAQAIVNLIGNGIKYSKKGSVTVRILDKPHFYELQVEDTGIGIKEADRVHLFEKFHRVENSATADIMGTGLGLYITKSIIELMGGSIWVKSVYGKGSTFGFTLPKQKTTKNHHG